MDVLVIGRGGREHTIIMKLADSKQVDTIYAAPGNGGIQSLASCVDIDEMDVDGLVEFAEKKNIGLTVVGPENPLNAGIANAFQDAGLKVFAPTKEAALLEGSKNFAKELMAKYDIPTAKYETFTNPVKAQKYIKEKGAPIVIKADGLAAGKGVIVAETEEIAIKAIENMMINKDFKDAGAKVVIEECLLGREFSLMAFVHENHVYPMITSRDHKRAFDGDEGPNTGGMGAFAPLDDITDDILDVCYKEVLQKAADGMIEEGRSFTGILYAGLMMTEKGPKVIEFNTRFGDPETQVVLPLLENDLAQVFLDVLDAKDPELKWKDEYALGVVVASKGYPGAYAKGLPLPDFSDVKDSFVVHAGTKETDGRVYSDGGRVLLVGANAQTLKEAADKVYDDLNVFAKYKAYFYRRDIGKSAL